MRHYTESFRSDQQRLECIEKWLHDLRYWLPKRIQNIEDWTAMNQATGEKSTLKTGEPWKWDDFWQFKTHVQIPKDWCIKNSRLVLDVSGESQVQLKGKTTQKLAINPCHKWLFVSERVFGIKLISIGRGLLGAPVRDAAIKTAFLFEIEERLWSFFITLQACVSTIYATQSEAREHILELLEYVVAKTPIDTYTPIFTQRQSAISRINFWDFTTPFLEHEAYQNQESLHTHPTPNPLPSPPPLSNLEGIEQIHLWLKTQLAKLKKRFGKVGKVYLSGHAHIDYVWLWDEKDTQLKALRTYANQIAFCNRYKHFVFNQSQAALSELVRQGDPELFAQIQQKVKDGVWDIVGGMWVETDTNMPNAEAFCRQILYGQQYFLKHFGVRCKTAWLPDTFGFSGALPQIFHSAGLENMVTIKVNWNEKNKMPDNVFWWVGNDRSKILVHTFEAESGYNMYISAKNIKDVWDNFKNKTQFDATLANFGYGDGGSGPTVEQIQMIEALDEMPVIPKVKTTRVKDFMDKMRKTAQKSCINSWMGEMYLEYHRATLTSQSRTKAFNRRVENALVTLELLQSAGHLLGEAYPDDLENLWRVLLKNQFHDALPGSSITAVYAQIEQELSTILKQVLQKQKKALQNLIQKAQFKIDKNCLSIFNPHACGFSSVELVSEHPFSNAVKVHDGYAFCTKTNLKGLMLQTLKQNQTKTAFIKTTDYELENEFVRIKFNKNGTLRSVFDKRTQKEVLQNDSQNPGNALWVYNDQPRKYDAWNIEANFELGGTFLEAVSCQKITYNTMMAEIEVLYNYKNSRIRQIYRLWATNARLDIITTMDLHDRHCYFRALFPVNIQSDYATFDQAIGVVRRPTHNNTSWQRAQFECSAHHYVALCEHGFGAAILSQSKYGFCVKDSTMSISLAKTPMYPDPFCDEGVQTFTYSFLPFDGKISQGSFSPQTQGTVLNQPLLLCDEMAGEETAILKNTQDLKLHALKRAQDGRGLILRVSEKNEGRFKSALEIGVKNWEFAEQINTLEESLGTAKKNFTPFEMKSFRIEKNIRR